VNETLEGRQIDFLWPTERVIVETDGRAAHGRRDSFDADRARDLHFEARGYRTARVSERNMRRKPLVVLVRVGALLLAHSAATSHQ
jgi:very-short-patch-repair endonuclease